jgi:TPR repeat protein
MKISVVVLVSVLIAALALILTSALAADFEKGFTAYSKGDFATALEEWRPLAAQGNAAAQNNLGLMYYHGQGVPQDFIIAHMWVNVSAANGIEEAAKGKRYYPEQYGSI